MSKRLWSMVTMLISALTLVLLCSSTATAGEPDLIGWWKLDECEGTIAYDSSPYGNDGTLRGNPMWTEGRHDECALRFNGFSDWVDLNASIVDTTADYSVAAWVLMDQVNGWRTAVSQEGMQVSGYFLQKVDIPPRGFGLAIPIRDFPEDSIRAIADFEPSTNRWYHLVGTNNSASREIRIYVNGSLAARNFVTAPIWSAEGNTVIGRARWASGPVDFWPGKIEDVRIYDRVLSEDDVADLYDATK